MKHPLTHGAIAVIIAILFLILSNSSYFSIPVENANQTSYITLYTENKLSDSFTDYILESQYSNSNPKNIGSILKSSIRDQNNNKISDCIDSWIEEGYNELDVIVIYDHELSETDIQRLLDLGVEIGEIYKYLDMIGLSSVPIEKMKTITELPGVHRIENHGTPVLYSDIATPAVKARESDLYSPNTAWELGYTGKGANIAVVDTGVDNGHPSLAGKWVGGVDISKPEIPLVNPYDGSKDADDTNGHGTTCTGIAMGTGAPEGIYMGAAPDAKVVDVRIGTMIGYAPGEGPLSFYDASLKGIEWVIEHREDSWSGQGNENKGIDIISLSWGIDVGGDSDGSDAYSSILDRAVQEGVIVCHAAGNSGPNNNGFDGFAAASNGISVAASDDLNTIDRADDIIAEYSSRGPRHDNGDGNPYNELKPDITAPGTRIMQVQYVDANPELNHELIKEILHFTAERRGSPSAPELDPFWNRDFGWGVVDAYKAVKVASEIKNIGAFDVNLQCFITSIETPDIGDENITSGTITIQGVAFSKEGELEDIEIAIDNGIWKEVKDIEENGTYKFWEYKVDTTQLDNENHTIKARAVGPGGQSLEDDFEVSVFNKPTKAGGITSEQLTISIIVILIIMGAIFVYLYSKKRK